MLLLLHPDGTVVKATKRQVLCTFSSLIRKRAQNLLGVGRLPQQLSAWRAEPTQCLMSDCAEDKCVITPSSIESTFPVAELHFQILIFVCLKIQ